LKGGEMEIRKLTPEEIQTLQVDAALRLLGEYSNQLAEVNARICEAMKKVLSDKIALQELQSTKETLVEMMRALKTIAQRA
jgi:hypothetical protein